MFDSKSRRLDILDLIKDIAYARTLKDFPTHVCCRVCLDVEQLCRF